MKSFQKSIKRFTFANSEKVNHHLYESYERRMINAVCEQIDEIVAAFSSVVVFCANPVRVWDPFSFWLYFSKPTT